MSQEFLPILSGADFPSTEQPMAEFVPSLDSSWRLVIVNHKVHCDVANCKGPRQRPPKSICQCLTISNLRAFSVAVELQDGFGCKVREHPQVILQATVVYENGEEISLRHNESQFDESFLNECLLVSGAAQFSLRFGQQVLTDKHRRRLFCIRITAKDPQYQSLWAQTDPMRSVVKLPCMRKDRRNAEDSVPPESGPSYSHLVELKKEIKEEVMSNLAHELSQVVHKLREEIREELRKELMAELRQYRQDVLAVRRHTSAGCSSSGRSSMFATSDIIEQLEDAVIDHRNMSGRGQTLLASRMLPPSRHASDKNPPQDEKRRRG